MAVVSDPTWKFVVGVPTARPFVSTQKAGPLPAVVRFTVKRTPIPRLLINEFEAAGMMSVMTISNCVEEGMDMTVPSTVSTVGLAKRGSISWIVKVPSELRTASMLAASPVELVKQVESEVGELLQRVLVGSML
jgi:hypothetical protein